MNKDSLKRLVGPTVLLLVFVLSGLNTEGLLRQFGFDSLAQVKTVFMYSVQIGLWLSAAFFLNRLVAVFFWDGVVARTVKGQIPRLLKDTTALILYATAGTGIMAFVFDKSVVGVWATSGVVGIVLGFALRNMILDLFTGLAVNLDQPYKLGDWIMINESLGEEGNLIGRVEEINWRTTRLRTTENNLLVVPNSVLGQKVITNFMRPGEQSRFELDFTLDFSVPTERVLRVMTAAVRAVAGSPDGPLAEPPPKVRVTSISELGVRYRVRYWIVPREVSPSKARHAVISSILKHLHQAGITLAYPKQDAYFAPMPKRQLDTGLIEDRCTLLSRVPWLEALDEDERRRLAAALVERRFAPGDELVKQGETGDSMFIVVEGLAEALVRSAKLDSEVKVGQLIPGEFIGEMSLLTGASRSATVRAVTGLVAYEVRKEHLAPLLEARPELAEAIGNILAERKTRTEQALAASELPPEDVPNPTGTQRIVAGIKTFFKSVFGE